MQVGLTFALLIGMVLGRRRALVSGETRIRDIALGDVTAKRKPATGIVGRLMAAMKGGY